MTVTEFCCWWKHCFSGIAVTLDLQNVHLTPGCQQMQPAPWAAALKGIKAIGSVDGDAHLQLTICHFEMYLILFCHIEQTSDSLPCSQGAGCSLWSFSCLVFTACSSMWTKQVLTACPGGPERVFVRAGTRVSVAVRQRRGLCWCHC